MKRKWLAAMAIAVSVSAVPMTAYAASDVSDSASVNAESQTESEVPNPEETPAQEPAAAPDAEADAAAEVSEKPSSEQTAADTPSVQSEEDGALSVPSGENTAASEASEESAAPSAQSAGEAAEGERARKTVYEAGWNQVKDAEGNDHWIFYDAQTGAPKTGLFTEGGKTYLAAADTGYLLTGAQTYTDENGVAHVYYSSEEGGQPGAESAYGTIVKDGFADVDGQTRYFDKDGKMYTQEGWITVQDKTYYIMNGAVCKNGNYATDPTSGWLILDGEWYLLDTADGHRLSGLQKNGNDLYYLDPEQNDKMFKSTNQEDGWKQLNGTWYFFRGWGGALNNGWNKLGNDWYWFHEDCSMASAEWIREGGNLYYVRDWGGMLHDQWRKENGIWYYFRGWGAALNNGWSKIGNDWYWFNSDCTMASAQWIEEGGNLYYVRDWGGMLHDQWRQENGVWYYFRGWGAALNNGWSKIGNDWYWFNSDCKMASSQWLQQGENWYYLRDWGGRLHSGEFVVDGETYYFNADGVLTDKKELSQVIVIDPGHQGQGDSRKEPVGPGSSVMKARVTSGTTGCVSGLDEYELNLQVSLLLRTELESRGYTVYMTRETHDVNISNKERAEYASSVGGDILVRIHANGDDNSSVNGALCMAPSDSNAFVSALAPESQRLSQCIIDSYCQATGLRNRGVMITDDMSGINWSTMPVTIVEMGFMSNAGDDSKMADSDFQKKMVDGIADGIDQYFQ
ncbi:N-acetylmuramoyl-L-alanine amidase [Lacrimispora saccharolytica]|nr:N-acetylmuramoyl-L-alanine amidase [Lacrimispora saccharolytica]